jgi:hypothetical protein
MHKGCDGLCLVCITGLQVSTPEAQGEQGEAEPSCLLEAFWCSIAALKGFSSGQHKYQFRDILGRNSSALVLKACL